MTNGFNGPWNPLCPYCGGYMHTGHTPDCPVTRARAEQHRHLLAMLTSRDPNSQPTPEASS